jgi:hypothetical protein
MGVKWPIHGVLTPDHHEGDRATRNLAEKGKRQEECAITRQMRGWKNSGKICRVSDSGEEGE